jgi:hypothetical protein
VRIRPVNPAGAVDVLAAEVGVGLGLVGIGARELGDWPAELVVGGVLPSTVDGLSVGTAGAPPHAAITLAASMDVINSR